MDFKTISPVAHACNPSTQETEARGLLCISGQTELHSEFQDNLGYSLRHRLQRRIEKKRRTRRRKKRGGEEEEEGKGRRRRRKKKEGGGREGGRGLL